MSRRLFLLVLPFLVPFRKEEGESERGMDIKVEAQIEAHGTGNATARMESWMRKGFK